MSSYGSLNVAVEMNENMNRKRSDKGSKSESPRFGKILMAMSLLLIGSATWYHAGGFEGSQTIAKKLMISLGKSGLKSARPDISFGSVVTSTTEYPFTVRISSGFADGAEVCTGSILSPNYVLTAAHCVHKKAQNLTVAPEKVWVYAGTTERYVAQPRSYERRQAEAVYVDPEYRRTNRDLAVVRLLGPFLPSGSVNWIPLSGTRPSPGTLSVALGWGSTDNKHVTSVLRKATMYVISDDTCKLKDPRELCTQGGSGNTCKGDSGGPLVVGEAGHEQLVGVNSWSVTDCNDKEHNVDVFEGVTVDTKFVESIISARPPLELMVKPGETSTGAEGLYSETEKLVFGKRVWENSEKSMVIAFNGNEWVVCASSVVEGGNPGEGFGGVVTSTNGDVEIGCAVFGDHVLAPSSIAMKLKDGKNQYVNLDGGYARKQGTFVNGYPVYVQGSFFVGRSGTKWCVSLVSMLDGIVKKKQVNFPGYYKTTNSDSTVTCANFDLYQVAA